MADPRLQKMAEVIVHYSLQVAKGDKVLLAAELPGLALMEALYSKLVEAGAHIKTEVIVSRFKEIFLDKASEEQLLYTSPFSLHEMQTCDKRIRVIAPDNTRALSHVEAKRHALASKGNKPISEIFMRRSAARELRWLVTEAPTVAAAQEASMSLSEYENFIFRAAYLDEPNPVEIWQAIEKRQQRMCEFLQQRKELHFKTAAGTDLKVNVEGMRWMNSCGKRNFPDGEIFTGPNLRAADGGVNGIVRFTYPALWQSTVIEDIELIFEKGRVCKASATKNEALLQAMIEQDEGACRLGEIAIGTNYRIPTFTHNILLDEKIGGTFHAALGAGYPETGNDNISALHWDLVADLRGGGTIEADGILISKDGKFIEGWTTES